VRQRRNVLDALHIHSGRRERRDRTLATASRTADPHLEVLDSEFGRLLSRLLGSALTREGRPFATPLKATRSTAGPAERIAPRVGNRDGRIVETGVNKRDPSRNTLLLGFGNLGHG